MQTPGARGRVPERSRQPRRPGPPETGGGFDAAPPTPDDHARRMLHPDPRADLRNLASDLDRLAETTRPVETSRRAGIGAAVPSARELAGEFGSREYARIPGSREERSWEDTADLGARSNREYAGSHGRRSDFAEHEEYAEYDEYDEYAEYERPGQLDQPYEIDPREPRPGRRPASEDAEGEAHDQIPVFVDASGHRRKMARRISIGAVGILAGYGALVAVSFAGGPIPPGVLLPVPGIPAAKAPSTPGAVHGAANPGATTHATTGAPAEHPGGGTAKPGAGPTGAAPGATTPGAKQTTVPMPSGTASASASATASATKNGNGNTSNPHKHTRPSP